MFANGAFTEKPSADRYAATTQGKGEKIVHIVSRLGRHSRTIRLGACRARRILGEAYARSTEWEAIRALGVKAYIRSADRCAERDIQGAPLSSHAARPPRRITRVHSHSAFRPRAFSKPQDLCRTPRDCRLLRLFPAPCHACELSNSTAPSAAACTPASSGSEKPRANAEYGPCDSTGLPTTPGERLTYEKRLGDKFHAMAKRTVGLPFHFRSHTRL